MGMTWFGTTQATVSFDPGPSPDWIDTAGNIKPDLAPPSGPGWVNQGLCRYFRPLAPFWYADVTGKIYDTSQAAWAAKFAAMIWAKMGLTALIAQPATDWLSMEDAAVLGKALGADGLYTWENASWVQDPSNAKPQIYLAYEGGAVIRPAGADLNILRRNGPVQGLIVMVQQLGQECISGWKPPYVNVEAYLTALAQRP